MLMATYRKNKGSIAHTGCNKGEILNLYIPGQKCTAPELEEVRKVPEIKLIKNLSSFLCFESALPLFLTGPLAFLCTEGIPTLLSITVYELLGLRQAHKETA